MTERSPWVVEKVDRAILDRLAAKHAPAARAVELGVDILSDPHREDDEGFNWTLLSQARDIADVVPGSAVVVGTSIGRYLAKVIAWDFEVDDDDPVVTLELLAIRPSEVEHLLARNGTPAA